MRSSAKIYILFFLYVIALSPSLAQYRFEVEAPATADLDGYFHLKYVVNSTDVEKFLPPRINDFDILSGPSTMVSRDYRIVNGKESSSSSTTYTFVLSPLKKGSFVIPSASIVINGKTIRSKSVTIEVSGSGTGKSSSQMRGSRQDEQLQSIGSKVTAHDLFITVTPSRKKIYEQEAVLLTYKVHSRIGVGLTNIGLSHKPDFKDIVSQELPMKAISSDVERIGNTMYRTGVIMQYIIFPQRAGKLHIPGITFDCSVAQHDSSIDIMDAIFNGGGNIGIMVKRTSPEIVLEVKPLPQPKPANFSGGVGHFTVKGELLTTDLKTNDVATYRITVSGKGNLKLMQAPKIQFPKDFDAYAPNVKEDIRTTADGVSGKVVYDYTFVPHNAGEYNLPAAAITYFDGEAEKYVSLETSPLRLSISQGKRTSEDLKHELYLRNSDIRPLKTGRTKVYASGSEIYWWGTPLYWIINLLIIVFGLAISFWMRKRIRENTDESKRRQKRAGKRVEKRMKECERILSDGNDTEFYAEIGRTLSEYFADKFGVGISDLNKERVTALLEEANIGPEVVKECIYVWEECEMAQFAPVGEADKKERIYEMAQNVITRIEKRTVRSSGHPGMKMLSLIFMFVLTVCPVCAQKKQQADSAYAAGNYVEAARIYEESVKTGVSSDLYYNLGNAYYRLNDLPRAILNYERALRMEPANRDASYNLELCQSKLADRFDKQSEMFFITWMRCLVTGHSTDFWGNCALGCLIIFLLGGMVCFLSQSVFVRKCAFIVAAVFLILTAAFQIFAALQWNTYKTEHKAVVMEVSQSYASPSNSAKKVRMLHEGTTVRIVDEFTKDWYQVEMPDGNMGWIMKRQVEKV